MRFLIVVEQEQHQEQELALCCLQLIETTPVADFEHVRKGKVNGIAGCG